MVTMNLLTSRLTRFDKITTFCCRDAVKSLQKLVADRDRNSTSCPCTAKSFQYPFTPGNVHISAPSMWTQVRYAKSPCPPPRFHRDVEMPNFDAYRKEPYKDVRKTMWGSGDEKPGSTYVLGVFGLICGFYGAKGHVIHYLSYMSAAADVLALASVEVDLTKVPEGGCISVKWRGKPLFIKHRTQNMIDIEAATDINTLRDPQKDTDRVQKLEWLIVIGICTHLGCVPMAGMGDFVGGFYCPCHGSHFDNLGRARKGPAPTNLVVPPYVFTGDTTVLVG